MNGTPSVALDADVLGHAAAALSPEIGLVLALKAAEAPETFAAEIERAYIDGHQARLLFAADRLGGPGDQAGGLRDAFLIMLVPLLANAALVLLARRSYLTDVASARRGVQDR